MAGKKSNKNPNKVQKVKPTQSAESPKPKSNGRLPWIILAVVLVFVVMMGYQKGYFNFGHIIHTNDPFLGEWVSVSPATSYLLDPGGERYTEYVANYDLNLTNDGKYYIGDSSRNLVSYKTVPTYSLGADYPPFVEPYSPISFDARNYVNMPMPYPGIGSVEISGNTMTVDTTFSGFTQRIVFTLVKADSNTGKDTLYVTLSSMGPSNKSPAGGDETDTPIVLVRQ